MVGDVHKEFSKTMGSKIKGLRKDEIREKKHEWIRSQLASSRSRKKDTPAA
jgi:hypothetical protein